MLKVVTVVGTRPEAIKMAPVIRQLSRHSAEIESIVCSTGQHRHMLDQVFRLFDIVPDIELNVMQPNQGLANLTARLTERLDSAIDELKPDWVLAQGDTTTVLAAALVSYYRHVPFGHVEAGLRTGNLYHPFPEEMNRRTADVIGKLLFAPTEVSRQNLLQEGCSPARIIVTGNTVIDALRIVARMAYDWGSGPLARVPGDKRLVLITAHRRENFGQPMQELCMAVRDLASHYAGKGIHCCWPVHLNPNVRQCVDKVLGEARNITLLEPLDYLSLVQLMKRSTLVLTDSGGIQEEAPGLGVPVLVMRDTTERPEGVDAGAVKLVGTSRAQILREATAVLDDSVAHRKMTTGVNPYGDGMAAERIVAALLRHGCSGEKVA